MPAEFELTLSFEERLNELRYETMLEGIRRSDQLFSNILKQFTVPFFLSIAMNVALFVFGMVAFTAGLIYSLLSGKSDFGLVFGGLDVITFLTYFFNKPIERLERDVGFITWLGLVYGSFWIGVSNANPDSKVFRMELSEITSAATSSIQDLLDKWQKPGSSKTERLVKTSQQSSRELNSQTPSSSTTGN